MIEVDFLALDDEDDVKKLPSTRVSTGPMMFRDRSPTKFRNDATSWAGR
jgi:hypothetical protein